MAQMSYQEFKDGIKLSKLGMGNMRLPIKQDAPEQPIDYEAAKAIIDDAMEAGVNYYDTAYIYHGGEAEVFNNEAKISGVWRLGNLPSVAGDKLPSTCVECGACGKHCPQSFEIPKYMKELDEMMKSML